MFALSGTRSHLLTMITQARPSACTSSASLHGPRPTGDWRLATLQRGVDPEAGKDEGAGAGRGGAAPEILLGDAVDCIDDEAHHVAAPYGPERSVHREALRPVRRSCRAHHSLRATSSAPPDAHPHSRGAPSGAYTCDGQTRWSNV